ncbi:MAG: hypothetical protein ACFB11_22365 [Paracoccaceae bacterium]
MSPHQWLTRLAPLGPLSRDAAALASVNLDLLDRSSSVAGAQPIFDAIDTIVPLGTVRHEALRGRRPAAFMLTCAIQYHPNGICAHFQ